MHRLTLWAVPVSMTTWSLLQKLEGMACKEHVGSCSEDKQGPVDLRGSPGPHENFLCSITMAGPGKPGRIRRTCAVDAQSVKFSPSCQPASTWQGQCQPHLLEVPWCCLSHCSVPPSPSLGEEKPLSLCFRGINPAGHLSLDADSPELRKCLRHRS